MSTTTAAPSGTTADQIEAVRAFNRFYTARVGALRDGLLATAHPLPEARVLFELGRAEASTPPTSGASSSSTAAT